MKNLTPAELAVVSAVDRDRIADDLAGARPPSPQRDRRRVGAVQTEAALRMATAGLEVTRIDVDPQQIVADPDFPGMEAAAEDAAGGGRRDRPGRLRRRVMIAGHIDVGVGRRPGRVEHDPAARSSTARLYGRGSLDMKGGVVAGLATLRALRRLEVELDGEALLLTVPSEEDGGAGMLAAIRAGYTAEMAVITEPTGWRS